MASYVSALSEGLNYLDQEYSTLLMYGNYYITIEQNYGMILYYFYNYI